MAGLTTSALSVYSGLVIYKQTDANAGANNNITASTATVYCVIIDNTGNPTQSVHTKLYDNAAPTVGTTVPDEIMLCQGGALRAYFFPDGLAFGTALSFACTQEAGTGGTTDPTADVTVTIFATT